MFLRLGSEFGNLEDNFTPIKENLKLGVGLLYCEIQTFKFLSNLSYGLDMKKSGAE